MIDRRLFLAAALASPFASAAAAATLPGRVVRHPDFASGKLAPRHIDVWLPPQAAEGKPLPLLVMHDGQNLFSAGDAYGGQTWGVAEAATRLAATGAIPPTIIAGVWNTPKRWQEYVPAGILSHLPDRLRQEIEKEQGGPSLSGDYLGFLGDILLPFLRRTYAIAPGPAAIMGSSMGGLISLAALVERPHDFAAAGCVSTHWPLGAPKPERANYTAAATHDWLHQRLGRPNERKLWFDHGDQTLDANYEPFQESVDKELATLGWRNGVDYLSRAYPGASHNEVSWRARIAEPLAFLLGPA